ncbi:hypothetical protein NQ317_016436 [Molorchus minor]|uniref:Uncharacterized protein n=1 Tax=Molorchus minor TaxID=1323400 RepID=A0ABQ9JXZ2_9CUCU|nr:hypothetical protein NQ317_016436 [Molorchus minor]
MKVIAVVFLAVASAADLDNTYLPPRLAGGHGNILTPPLPAIGDPIPLLNRAQTATFFGNPSPAGGFSANPQIPILRYNSDNSGTGTYRFNFETANHIAAEETGHQKNVDNEEVQGSFSYQSPDGQPISVSYVADENGFRASGDHLPTPPPIPDAILKSLELNAGAEARGQYGSAPVKAGLGAAAPSIGNQYLPPVLVVILLAASAAAGRLDNLYLPPNDTPTNDTSNVNTVGPSPYTQVIVTPTPATVTPVAPIVFNTIPSSNTLYGASLIRSYPYVIAATPATPPIPILRHTSQSNSQGTYRYEYETANHIVAQETGNLKNPSSAEVVGSYSYLAPNGETISLNYIADENGFRPSGNHLPTPPPVPEAILRSLEINAAEEARGIVDDGQYRPAGVVVAPPLIRQYVPTSYIPQNEVVVTRRVVTPTNSTQYLPPVVQNIGYQY